MNKKVERCCVWQMKDKGVRNWDDRGRTVKRERVARSVVCYLPMDFGFTMTYGGRWWVWGALCPLVLTC